jgi:flavin-dependent dehydrogenase
MTHNRYDIILVGGAVSGAATALLAKRSAPQLKILIVEKNDSFKRRVGESTVEVSSYFLAEVLGLQEYLSKEHLVKQGLRFYFQNKDACCADSCSEIGPHYNVRLTSYQVDRAKLDQHLLAQCEREGIELRKSVLVKDIELNSGGTQVVEIKNERGEFESLKARWLVDASGIRQLVARKYSWAQKNTEHPIHSAWARWSGVRHWDSTEMKEKFPEYGGRCFARRNTATNHLIGRGWWSWWIPLQGGDVSIGIVWDERITNPPDGPHPKDRLRGLLAEHPMADYMLEDAEVIEGDVHWRKYLPYYSEKMVGDGFALVGDAAAFMDPFYSPGLDWVSFTAYGTADMIVKNLRGDYEAAAIAKRNDLLTGSYQRWFKAIYKDKYYYMGDWELMKLAFRLDLGLYYLGVVSQPYKYGNQSFTMAPLNGPNTGFPAWLIAKYNSRLASIGRERMRRGTWGRNNARAYYPFKSFGFDSSLILRNLAAIGSWLRLELCEGWRTWGRKAPSES